MTRGFIHHSPVVTRSFTGKFLRDEPDGKFDLKSHSKSALKNDLKSKSQLKKLISNDDIHLQMLPNNAVKSINCTDARGKAHVMLQKLQKVH